MICIFGGVLSRQKQIFEALGNNCNHSDVFAEMLVESVEKQYV